MIYFAVELGLLVLILLNAPLLLVAALVVLGCTTRNICSSVDVGVRIALVLTLSVAEVRMYIMRVVDSRGDAALVGRLLELHLLWLRLLRLVLILLVLAIGFGRFVENGISSASVDSRFDQTHFRRLSVNWLSFL